MRALGDKRLLRSRYQPFVLLVCSGRLKGEEAGKVSST